MIKVYCYSKCTTCKKALKWLEEKQVAYEVLDIKEQHPDEKTLRKLYEKSGLPLIDEFLLTFCLVHDQQQGLFKILASDGMLVKRPLLITEEKVLTGFKEAEWEAVV